MPSKRWTPAVLTALILAAASGSVQALTYHLELGRAELQLAVQQLFPLDRSDPLVTVRLRDPEVVLRDGSERIGVRVALEAGLAGGATATGRLALDGRLRYVPARGALFLDQARIGQLQIDGVSATYTDQVRLAVEPLVRDLLATRPVYVLGDRQEFMQLSKRQVRSVQVRDGRVFVELAAF